MINFRINKLKIKKQQKININNGFVMKIGINQKMKINKINKIKKIIMNI